MLKYLIPLVSIVLAVWTVPEWLTFPIYGNVANVFESWLRQSVSDLSSFTPGRMLTEDELSLYNGEPNSKGLYLAILGEVFDVERGRKHYGPGGSYHFFTGKFDKRALYVMTLKSLICAFHRILCVCVQVKMHRGRLSQVISQTPAFPMTSQISLNHRLWPFMIGYRFIRRTTLQLVGTTAIGFFNFNI